MRRIINVGTLAAIFAGVVVVGWQYRGGAAATPVAIDAFAVGQQKQVHFRVAPEALESLSDDALDDQLRDWLLYAALAESTLDAEGVRDAMYDVPPTRANYVHPVAAFDYGPARFRIIDDAGSVIALVPQDSKTRIELIAQIADAARTRLGSAPRVLRVFEYRIDPVELTGWLTRASDIAGDELYTAAYGYVQRDVRSVAELKVFLEEAGDLGSAVPIAGGVALGGRRKAPHSGRRMSVEDVAALWQSESAIAHDQEAIKQLDARWTKENQGKLAEELFESEKKALLQQYPRRGESRRAERPQSFRYGDDELRRALEQIARDNPLQLPSVRSWPPDGPLTTPQSAEAALADFNRRWHDPSGTHLKGLLQARYDSEVEALKSQLHFKSLERVPDASGFSLDPAYDYAKLRAVVAHHRAELVLRAGAGDMAAAEQGLSELREDKLLAVLFRLANRPADAAFARAVENDLQRAKFQHARYDGPLKGTEVGMVLFYTDLMAKLWALDYQDSAPDKRNGPYVRGFVPLLKITTSPIYDAEDEQLRSTRLWFGPRDAAFAKHSDRLLFAPIATRVYAASSNSLQPGKEAEANASSAEFLGWWNDHYAQIAEFEPEYQRLNQIMKWSTALAWLTSVERLHALSFLDDNGVRVERDHWFPSWAAAHTGLKFRGWDRIRFKPAGFEGIDTESMDLLSSRLYPTARGFHVLSGGVTGASSRKIAARPNLVMHAQPRVRRANIAEVTYSSEGTAVRSFDHVNYTMRSTGLGRPAVVQAKSETKLRGHDLELQKSAFAVSFERHSGGLRARVGVNEHAVGELTVTRRGSGAIEVAFDPLEVEYARAFSKTLSRATAAGEHPLSALAARPDVNRVIEREGTYFVEPVSGGAQWLKIAPEGSPSVNLTAGVDLRFSRRVSMFERGGDRWTATFVDRVNVEEQLSRNASYIQRQPAGSPVEGVAFSIQTRGPPPASGRVIDIEGLPAQQRKVLAALDDTGHGGGRRAHDETFGFSGAGGRRRLAHRAAKDPDHTVRILAEARTRQLDRADVLIGAGRFDEARIELDRLAALLPEDWNVNSRRVVAHAASASRSAAAEAARLPIDSTQLHTFLEIADRASARIEPLSPARAQLDTIVRGLVARANRREAHYINIDGELGIEVRLADAMLTPMSTRPPDGSVRYSLVNLDTAPTVPTGHVPPATADITAKLRDLTVAIVEPERIVDLRSKAQYQKGTATRTNTAAQQSFRTTYDVAASSCAPVVDAPQAPSDCRDAVYLAGPQASDGPLR